LEEKEKQRKRFNKEWTTFGEENEKYLEEKEK
jgi:hypothetical protein